MSTKLSVAPDMLGATTSSARPILSNVPKKKIRVVHLVSTLNIGGLEKVVYDLLRFGDQDAFDFQVWCLGEIGALADRFAELNIPVVSLGLLHRGTLRAMWKLRQKLKGEQVDVLHTHNPSPHIVGAGAAALSRNTVLVHTKHGRNYPKDRKKVLWNRVASWFTDTVVAVSNDARDVAIEIERVPAKKVHVIQNGIELPAVWNTNRDDSLMKRAIHVARLSRPKDFRTLLEATKLVVAQVPDFQLDLVGDGPQRADVETWCDELQLRDSVKFLGFRKDVLNLLEHTGISILSSTAEGLSITILEAMASGLPVVATDVGGNPELVKDGETGLLVPAKSAEAMAEALLKLVRQPSLARELGQAGRRRIENHFDLRVVVAQYQQLYTDLVAKRLGVAAR
jgi:glycosyltransferase involved in cell wall biosynthesis